MTQLPIKVTQTRVAGRPYFHAERVGARQFYGNGPTPDAAVRDLLTAERRIGARLSAGKPGWH